MIRGIIFDCFGVLYGGSLETLVNMCPPEKQAELHDLNKQADYGYISDDDYVRGLMALLDKSRDEIIEIFRAKHIRNEELVDYVRSLKSQYKLGLLSNVRMSTIEKLFSPQEMDTLFDAVVLSYQEGIAKPNPAVFVLTAERLGVPVDECIMIDDLAVNCDAAEVAGMQSILHTSNYATIGRLSEIFHKNS